MYWGYFTVTGCYHSSRVSCRVKLYCRFDCRVAACRVESRRVVLYCIVSCHVMLCCVVLCCVVLCCVSCCRVVPSQCARGIGTVTCHLMLGSPPTRAASCRALRCRSSRRCYVLTPWLCRAVASYAPSMASLCRES
jgi:hypothetical protein